MPDAITRFAGAWRFLSNHLGRLLMQLRQELAAARG